MKDPDDELMWGFQRRFRGGVERELESALSAIGLPVEVRIVLVGFATGDGDRPRISVERVTARCRPATWRGSNRRPPSGSMPRSVRERGSTIRGSKTCGRR